MYIDVYFLINLVVDRCALECAIGRLGVSKRKLWLGAVAGAAGACLWEIWITPVMLQPFGALLLAVMMVYICIGARPWRQWCGTLVRLYMYGFLFAGVIPYVSRYMPLWIISVLISFGGIKAWMLWQGKGKRRLLTMMIEIDGVSWKGKGMVDTGHLLKEPITGKAVIIVDRAALPQSWEGKWPIVYQSVQGKGILYGLWPQKMQIDEQVFKEKEIMVAVAEEWKEKGFSAIIPGYLVE